MRIFYASDTTPNASLNSNLWRNNLLLPLQDLGHEIIEFDYNLRKTFQNLNPVDPLQKRFIKKNRPRLSHELLKQIKKHHAQKPIDLFFSYFYDACVLPEVIDEIKSMRIKTVNWYCNGSYQLDLVSEISPHYDYCLVPEEFRLDDYKALGANPIYCQEAANPNIYKQTKTKEKYDVTFIGQSYGDRPEYIKFLFDNNIDIRVWGVGWKKHAFAPIRLTLRANAFKRIKKLFSKQGTEAIRYHLHYLFHPAHKQVIQNLGTTSTIVLPKHIVGDVLSDNAMIKLYSQSKINLGFSSCGNTHQKKERILQVRLRDFEVPMSGGFYMVEYMEELEEFFEIGKEIVCYEDKHDLLDKIKYYLSHDSEREKIRAAGRARCLRDHTWQKRFTMVFKQIFK